MPASWETPSGEPAAGLGLLGSISLLVKWGYSQLAPPSWLSAS